MNTRIDEKYTETPNAFVPLPHARFTPTYLSTAASTESSKSESRAPTGSQAARMRSPPDEQF
jgi:hypothetical protein